jgi:hypothetical protein
MFDSAGSTTSNRRKLLAHKRFRPVIRTTVSTRAMARRRRDLAGVLREKLTWI